MATRITQKQIEAMVAKVAQLSGTPYRTDYAAHYGGYNMYYIPEGTSGHSRGKYGFDCRKSPKEMLAYLEGIIAALS